MCCSFFSCPLELVFSQITLGFDLFQGVYQSLTLKMTTLNVTLGCLRFLSAAFLRCTAPRTHLPLPHPKALIALKRRS